jgi:chemotaxis signal transduction protein
MNRVVPFRIDSTWFALPALDVEQILEFRDWVAIPGARAELPGVIPWKGEAIAVLDLAPLHPTLSRLIQHERPRALVARAGHHAIAIPAHAIREVREVPEGSHSTEPSLPPHVQRQLSLGGDQVALLDLPALLRRLEAP